MNEKRMIEFFFELATLRRLTRSHRQLIHGVDDNVSDHSFRVAIIGMTLARLEKCDENTVLKMCLFHDFVEARTGDANFINKLYVELHEERAREDQMRDLPIGEDILGLMSEYEKRESVESVVAKDADLLDQMILQQEYLFNDSVNREIWQTHTEQSLTTENAKRLAERIREANPFEWLYVLAEENTDETVKR
jgi:putative hydrolases of HD superfamily